MTSSPLISIIVPVYQTEQYLQECLKSLSTQTYKNLEFLLIDDGSTDRSSKICDEQSSVDSRFRVFHCAHAGIAASRNNGLQLARGEFIAWVDSDDSIAPDYIQTLYDALSANDADMSIAMHQLTPDTPRTLTDSMILQYQLDNKLGVLWSSLIRASLYRGKSFLGYSANEDRIMLTQICAEARLATIVENDGYHYRIRYDSAVHSPNVESMISRLKALETRNEWVKRNYSRMYKYTHYSSVLEATKVNRMLRNNTADGNTETLHRVIHQMINNHIFRIPVGSLSRSRLKEIAAGYKVLILGQ